MSFLLPPLPPTFDAALRDIAASSRDARIAAAERLARASDDEVQRASAALTALCEDHEAIVRGAAVRALGELHAAPIVDAADARPTQALRDASMIDAVSVALAARLNDNSPPVRELAAIALGHLGDERSHRTLQSALRSEHPEVRFQAIAGYAESAARPALEPLLTLLRDADAEVRGQAARAIANVAQQDPERRARVRRDLEALLDDSSVRTRAEAALALAKLQDPAAEKGLRAALDDAALRSEALEAIGALQLHTLVEPVAYIARNVFASPFERVAAARALVRLSDPRGLTALRSALGGFRRTPRVLAVQAIGELRLTELGPAVAKLADRARGVDAITLVDALERLAGESRECRAALERLATRSGHAAKLAQDALAGLRAPERPRE